MSTPNARLANLYAAGVSIWLDDLSRELIKSGQLAEKIITHSISGVTTNPSIFQAALSHGDSYSAQIKELAAQNADVDTAIRTITTDDVREACEVFTRVYEKTGGVNGRVSIEVDPRLAHETQETIKQAKELWSIVNKPNLLIKIPATSAGLEAITEVIAEGISVNVTLIFSLERYEQVIQAYLAGLEKARAAGKDLSTIYSVASFFVSRVDTEIDKRLEANSDSSSTDFLGKAGLANARLAYKIYQDYFEGKDFEDLKAAGANIQRPLWASTGTKNPEYSDTLYVSELVAPDTVNTIPTKTLEAFADHGEVVSQSIIGHDIESQKIFDQLGSMGVDLDDVFTVLEQEGVDKFIKAWTDLYEATEKQLQELRK